MSLYSRFSRHLSWLLLALIALVLSGCATAASAAPAPTFQPTETAVPLVTPTRVAASPPMAIPAFDDLEVHRRAMKPEFAGDVDGFADANRYLIVARLTLEPDAVIRGAERVRFTNRSPDTLDLVVFRLYPNSAALGGRMNVTQVTVAGAVVEPSLSILSTVMGVPLAQPLLPGHSVEITVDFNVVMTRGLNTSYGRFGYVNDVVSSTAWYPTLSVYEPGAGWWTELPTPRGDPGYTETGLYDVRLTLPSTMTVAMSGLIIETTPHDDGTTTYRDVTGPMRDHAFQASERYMITSGEADDTRINVVHYRDRATQPADGTQNALKFAIQSIKAFNKTFGEYPYAEFDVVQNPTPSGVEFPGLVQIADRSWVQGSNYLEIVIAHEVGHQWFYGMVGNNQVEQPWLDESLTSYTEFVYVREYYDAQRADDYVANFRKRYTSYTGSGQADLPLGLPVRSYTNQSYGAIVYTKGPLFLVELERLAGRQKVYEALAEYFARRRYQIAVTADVQAAFEDVIGRDLTEVFAEWVF